MHQTLIVLGCSLVSSLAAQTLIVPSVATSKAGNTFLSAFYGTPSTQIASEGHTLCLYDASDIALASGSLRSLQVRRPSATPFNNPATTITLEVTMSRSQVASGGIQTTFASNHDPMSRVTVFRGSVNLPARSQGSWPEPWEAKVPFSTPFAWAKSGTASLAVELTSSGNSALRTWFIEGYRPENGGQQTELSPFHCAHSGGTSNNSIRLSPAAIGQPWQVEYFRFPENTPSFRSSVLALGAQGRGGTFGGQTLPITLANLGIPSQPGCQLANDVLATVPMTYTTSTSRNNGTLRTPSLTIPNDRALIDRSFYTQPLCVDTDAATQRPVIYAAWASKWTIGSGESPAGSSVSRLGNNANPVGTISQGTVPALRFDG